MAFAATLTVFAAGNVRAEGWQYYGNRSGLSVGIGDGQSQGPGGGLSVGPGGGLSEGPGGGLSVGPGGGLSVGPGGGLSVGPGGGLSQGPGGGLSVGPGGGLSQGPLGGLSVAPCGGLSVAPCGMLAGPGVPWKYLVFFEWDKSELTARTLDIIHTAARNSTRVHYTLIDVAGHTDTSGPYGYNIRLSQRRAQAVAAELERQGVPGNAIDIHAYGYTQVLVPTGPDVREPQNRRVEIVFEE